MEEFMCQVFEKHPQGGSPTPIPGGGLLDNFKNCVEFGQKTIGKKVRAWKNEKETTAVSVGYKVWKRVA